MAEYSERVEVKGPPRQRALFWGKKNVLKNDLEWRSLTGTLDGAGGVEKVFVQTRSKVAVGLGDSLFYS